MLHVDIEDSIPHTPGIQVDIFLNGVSSPTVADQIALAYSILNSDIIKNVGWGGEPYIESVWIDSETTLFTAP